MHATPPPRHPSRRWALAAGGALVLGAAAGIGTEFATRDVRRARRPVPESLATAIATEQALIADLAATTGGSIAVRALIAAARADHEQHLAQLRALLRDYDPMAASRAPVGRPRTVTELRTAEQSAARAAATRAAATSGPLAPLFASISAAEAAHAELFA